MKAKFLPMALLAIILSFLLTGCGYISNYVNTVKGNLIGQSFRMLVYDDFGNNNMTIKGKRVSIGLLKNEANKTNKTSSASDTGDFKSEVLDITFDGNQILHVGSTTVFAEAELLPIEDYDYTKLKAVDSAGKLGFMPLERVVNKFANLIGKKKTIIVKSQNGILVGVYQGDSVYVEIPDDLPKMTRLNIDGKSLYIYRADYTIMDSKVITN